MGEEKFQQKSIEMYFKEHQITDPDLKVKLLPEITSLIYERNNHIVKAEKEDDPHLKEGHLKSAAECEEKIHEIINDFLKEQK